jgi:cysteinyl-tRNA synthetase
MAGTHLGETIDIHGGGLDLIFPHHENEIAQSRCANYGAPLARYWVHNGFVDMGAEKMSKSLGNIITPEELLKTHRGETLRMALLSAHYRKPLSWTNVLVEQQQAKLDTLYRRVGDAVASQPDPRVVAALSDDLNTPRAIGILHQIADPEVLKASAGLLGLLSMTQNEWFQESSLESLPLERLIAAVDRVIELEREVDISTLPAEIRVQIAESEERAKGAFINLLINARDEARGMRDFSKADEIRDWLKDHGIILEDGPTGTTWRRE